MDSVEDARQLATQTPGYPLLLTSEQFAPKNGVVFDFVLCYLAVLVLY